MALFFHSDKVSSGSFHALAWLLTSFLYPHYLFCNLEESKKISSHVYCTGVTEYLSHQYVLSELNLEEVTR